VGEPALDGGGDAGDGVDALPPLQEATNATARSGTTTREVRTIASARCRSRMLRSCRIGTMVSVAQGRPNNGQLASPELGSRSLRHVDEVMGAGAPCYSR